jgi:hypothetical protein
VSRFKPNRIIVAKTCLLSLNISGKKYQISIIDEAGQELVKSNDGNISYVYKILALNNETYLINCNYLFRNSLLILDHELKNMKTYTLKNSSHLVSCNSEHIFYLKSNKEIDLFDFDLNRKDSITKELNKMDNIIQFEATNTKLCFLNNLNEDQYEIEIYSITNTKFMYSFKVDCSTFSIMRDIYFASFDKIKKSFYYLNLNSDRQNKIKRFFINFGQQNSIVAFGGKNQGLSFFKSDTNELIFF